MSPLSLSRHSGSSRTHGTPALSLVARPFADSVVSVFIHSLQRRSSGSLDQFSRLFHQDLLPVLVYIDKTFGLRILLVIRPMLNEERAVDRSIEMDIAIYNLVHENSAYWWRVRHSDRNCRISSDSSVAKDYLNNCFISLWTWVLVVNNVR